MFYVCDTLARTGSVNCSYGEPQVVCHLLSSCVHASITSKSDSKVFELNDKFQGCAVVFEGKNRRNFAKKDHAFSFVSVQPELFATCIARPADFQRV